MYRNVIQTPDAPQAIGPYSQAICTDNLVFVSGQIPIDPHTGEIVEATIEIQTRQVLQNVQAVLEAAGSSLDRVVKTMVFLKNIEDFAAMNAIYAEFFTHEPPARSAVQVAALPKGALVEIEVIALRE
jgi:2-iminobutanoate/2-iminopropanoate deaminase